MDAHDTPARRSDLVLTPGSEAGREFVVVHDPRVGRYFRLREVEGFLLSLLDGERTLEEVHASVLREFPGAVLRLPTLLAFVGQLERLGLLQGSPAGPLPKPPLHRRILRIKLPPVRIDGLLDALHPWIRRVYQPLPLFAILLLMLGAGYWAFFSAEELSRWAPTFHTPVGWLLLGAAIFTLNVVHEMGHGVTCRFFGARCNGIGIFLLYGLPCFYCDVSGAWALSSRRARMLIGLGGLGWQLAFGAVMFIAWKALEPYTLPARFCHVILSACGVTALFNLFPFIKLDGYYLLVDWLRVPNLREKAMRYIAARTCSLFFTTPAPRPAPRERRIYFWFGTLCWLSSTVLLALLATRVTRWLVGTWQGAGALLLGAILMTLVLSWARSLFASTASPTAPPSAPPTTPPARSTGEGKSETPPPAGGSQNTPQRARPRLSLILLVVAVIAGGVVFWNAKWMRFVASPCTLEAARRTPVRPEVEGVLQEAPFEEGMKVQRGDTFAVLESFDLVKRREQIGEDVKRVQAQTAVIAGEAPILETENARDVAQAAREVRVAKNELEDRSDLYPARRAEAEKRVKEARTALEDAERVAKRTTADVDGVEQGRLTPAMQAIAERMGRVQAQRELAKKEVQRATFLVSQGALQRQRLDQVSAELETLGREEAALNQDLAQLRKELIEKREDAVSEVTRQQASLEAAEQARLLVERETRPEKLENAREEIRSREALLDTTRRLRAAAELKRMEAAVKRLEARPKTVEMERLERKIRQTRVLAPVTGVVSTPRLAEKVGRKFARGETIAWIDRIDTLSARISVDEREIGEVKRGQSVQLRVGAFPDRMFDGKVEEVSPRAGPGGSRGAYEVRLRIPNPTGELRPGITGYAKIYCGRRPLREVVFRRLHRYIRTEVWTWF